MQRLAAETVEPSTSIMTRDECKKSRAFDPYSWKPDDPSQPFFTERLPVEAAWHMAEFKSACEAWDAARGEETMPRQAVPVEATGPMIGTASVLTIEQADPIRVRYTHYGPELVRFFPIGDMTGRLLDEFEPAFLARMVYGNFRDVLADRKPTLHGLAVNIDGLAGRYVRLCLPSSTDGRAITHIMTLGFRLAFLEQTETLSWEFVPKPRRR